MKDKIRFRVHGLWSQWGDFDACKIPENVEAVEVHETFTLDQFKKEIQFYGTPDQRQSFNKLFNKFEESNANTE